MVKRNKKLSSADKLLLTLKVRRMCEEDLAKANNLNKSTVHQYIQEFLRTGMVKEWRWRGTVTNPKIYYVPSNKSPIGYNW